MGQLGLLGQIYVVENYILYVRSSETSNNGGVRQCVDLFLVIFVINPERMVLL